MFSEINKLVIIQVVKHTGSSVDQKRIILRNYTIKVPLIVKFTFQHFMKHYFSVLFVVTVLIYNSKGREKFYWLTCKEI